MIKISSLRHFSWHLCCHTVKLHVHLNHKKSFHDAVRTLEDKSSRKVPWLDGMSGSVVLGNLLPVSVEQLLEGLHDRDGHLNSLHSLLYLHLEEFLGYEVGKSLSTDRQLLIGPYATKSLCSLLSPLPS